MKNGSSYTLINLLFAIPLERTSKMVCILLVISLLYTPGKRSDSHNSSPKHQLRFTVVISFEISEIEDGKNFTLRPGIEFVI